MTNFNRNIININAAVRKVAPKCNHIRAMHTLTSYLYNKGKTSGFNVLKHDDIGLECFGTLHKLIPVNLVIHVQPPILQ